jgi:hypothetical protein
MRCQSDYVDPLCVACCSFDSHPTYIDHELENTPFQLASIAICPFPVVRLSYAMESPKAYSKERNSKGRGRHQSRHHHRVKHDNDNSYVESSHPMRSSRLSRGHQNQISGGKDEFVQSWLKQTLTHDSRPPELHGAKVDREQPDRVSPRIHITPHHERGRKRAKSPSKVISKSPKHHDPEASRFRKRARHKTHEDRYDYKHGVGYKMGFGVEDRASVGSRQANKEEKGRRSESPVRLCTTGNCSWLIID